MATPELTCREFADFLMAYEDGELSAAERARFDAHLDECPDCIVYLRSYRATVALGRSAFQDEDADARTLAPEDLVRAVLAARSRSRH